MTSPFHKWNGKGVTVRQRERGVRQREGGRGRQGDRERRRQGGREGGSRHEERGGDRER